jgi:hypothetical protein
MRGRSGESAIRLRGIGQRGDLFHCGNSIKGLSNALGEGVVESAAKATSTVDKSQSFNAEAETKITTPHSISTPRCGA